MNKKGRILESIDDSSRTLPEIDHSEIEQALGATADQTPVHRRGSPYSIASLRRHLMSELVSTGGRPGRRQAVSRKKVPLTVTEWERLDQIASTLKQHGVNASSGQVAGVLLHHSISEVISTLSGPKGVERAAAPVQSFTDADLQETLETIRAAAANADVHLEQLLPVALELLRLMKAGKGIESK